MVSMFVTCERCSLHCWALVQEETFTLRGWEKTTQQQQQQSSTYYMYTIKLLGQTAPPRPCTIRWPSYPTHVI